MKQWVKMPSDWIKDGEGTKLRSLKWQGEEKSDYIAALMLYLIFVHHANDEITTQFDEVGRCSITYDALLAITGLSKAKISGGIQVLKSLELILVLQNGNRNVYVVKNYGEFSGWAKLPAKRLYSRSMSELSVFQNFKLRSKVELNALKIYLLILALRNNHSNAASVSYEKISTYTGVARNDIRKALSFLVTQGLVHVDQHSTEINEYSTSSRYRPCFIDAYKHQGTSGRVPK
ncbi:hypothetical protein Q3O60_05285 [Alkalimonas collagenimarina]|uniref:Helix-turn-helix domain-containing protein n=1 Tax=Alkalimonas collagenimarina TaxID=400390 RepID=A0ABT9GX02_9GAMM|nr:helix-turn-helix domain-containing protein [Alkalimonas collagenimarina]MDP4535592.1 hypothetical protein [Alkalimonas collagenimarina]